MATVDEALASQIRNIEQQYGKTLKEWMQIISKSGYTKHNEIVAMLKSDHGMTHGHAHRLALMARGTDAASIVKKSTSAGENPVDSLYAGKKAKLKPLHETLIAYINSLGNDIEYAAKKGYVSIRRRKQFAMIQPGADKLNIGLVLKNEPTTKRLESAATFNALFTHRIRLTSPAEIDSELRDWLKESYRQAE